MNTFNEILKAIFEKALSLDEVEREKYFKNLSSKEKKYIEEVRSLIDSYQSTEDFLEIASNQQEIFSFDKNQPHPLIGKRIGQYTIEKEIGIGGMGIVFTAVRADKEFKQKVAIKILKQGLTTKYLIKRFENERQILANLQHPNIAKLFDGGKTIDGLPYLVMEYIEGTPITVYCSNNNLNIEEKLKLFTTVCSAVQYAHQNLIIHRDLKPGNILVTAEGRPKLLDFGVAKLLDESLVQENIKLTQTKMMHLTPEYASPEQINGNNITTASDVYSLGVILYQLLTGEQPYQVNSSSPLAISKIISEEKIVRPSEILKIKKTKEGTLQKLNISEKSLSKLKGDLDNIVLKAMHKDVSQRYISVQELIDDINRYLKGLPVKARKDTLGYRFTKFVQRHKVGVALFILFNIIILTSIAAVIYQGRIAARERDKAKTENQKYEKVNEFLTSILSSVDPSEIGRDVKVYDILEKAAEDVNTELKNQPEVEASIRSTLGNTYVNLGEYDKGKPFLEKAYEINLNLYGENSKETATSIHDLGLYYDWIGDYKKADSLYSESISIFRNVLKEPAKIYGDALNNLAIVKMHFSQYDIAEKLYLEAIEISKKVEGEKSRNIAVMMNNLAYNYSDAGKLDKAEEYYKKSLQVILEVLGENRPEAGTAYNNIAWLHMQKNELDSAEVYLNKSYQLKYKLKGKDHPDVGLALSNLGVLQFKKGNFIKAETYFLDAVKQYRKTYSVDHPLIAISNYWLGKVYRHLKNYDLSQKHFKKCLKYRLIKLPKDNWEIWDTRGELGITLLKQKHYQESEKLLKSSYEFFINKENPDTLRATNFLRFLVNNFAETGQKEKQSTYSSILTQLQK